MDVSDSMVVSSLVGIVSFLAEIPLVAGSPDVFVAAASGPYMQVLESESKSKIVGSGAGLTWDVASGAALGECLERYSSAIIDPEDLILGSFEELRTNGLPACEPNSWALFDHSQNVPYPAFTMQTRIAWREGWDLATGSHTYLPACLAYLSESPALKEFDSVVIGPAISTGCSCAVRQEDSLLAGLYELIERDAFMIAWRNRLPIPEVTIDDASDLYKIFSTRFSRPGLEYRIWQTSLDLPVPSFFGMLIDHRESKTRMIVGGAANLDAERAVLKTLCELTQGLSWLDSKTFKESAAELNIDDIHTFTDRARFYASRWRPEAFSFLQTAHGLRPLSSIPSVHVCASNALSAIVAEMSKRELRPLAVDLTTPDVKEAGFVVTRVMVPGLETMDGDHRLQMLGGRRWREVPITMGLVAAGTSIATLNPYPHPYP